MAAHLTAAEARKLGLTPGRVGGRTKRSRTVATGPYRTRCHTCQTVFETIAAEDRHVAPGHHRYELVWS